MKLDAYAEIYLWNKNIDSLIRVLQRMEALGVRSRQEMKVHEIRLEKIRAQLNAEFTAAMFVREKADLWRLKGQQTGGEKPESEGTKG
jgi:hypothetical protein